MYVWPKEEKKVRSSFYLSLNHSHGDMSFFYLSISGIQIKKIKAILLIKPLKKDLYKLESQHLIHSGVIMPAHQQQKDRC